MPVTIANADKRRTPSIIMGDLLKLFLRKTQFLAANKKATQLPNTVTSDRITTQVIYISLIGFEQAFD